MQIIADTHVHLYERYNTSGALRALCRNLTNVADACGTGSSTRLVACLTERKECHFFDRLLQYPPDLDGMRIAPGTDNAALKVEGAHNLTLYAGSQIISAERIEILALVCRERFPEGCPAAETIAAIRQAGGIPVLPWSPGKWLGARARCVRDLIESQEPASLCLGDTAMRPAGFPEPAFFRIARRHGLACIAGTDPLPVPGEESILGSFASRWTAPEEDAPLSADAFKRLLLSHTSDPAGQRNAAFTSARRWLANARAK